MPNAFHLLNNGRAGTTVLEHGRVLLGACQMPSLQVVWELVAELLPDQHVLALALVCRAAATPTRRFQSAARLAIERLPTSIVHDHHAQTLLQVAQDRLQSAAAVQHTTWIHRIDCRTNHPLAHLGVGWDNRGGASWVDRSPDGTLTEFAAVSREAGEENEDGWCEARVCCRAVHLPRVPPMRLPPSCSPLTQDDHGERWPPGDTVMHQADDCGAFNVLRSLCDGQITDLYHHSGSGPDGIYLNAATWQADDGVWNALAERMKLDPSAVHPAQEYVVRMVTLLGLARGVSLVPENSPRASCVPGQGVLCRKVESGTDGPNSQGWPVSSEGPAPWPFVLHGSASHSSWDQVGLVSRDQLLGLAQPPEPARLQIKLKVMFQQDQSGLHPVQVCYDSDETVQGLAERAMKELPVAVSEIARLRVICAGKLLESARTVGEYLGSSDTQVKLPEVVVLVDTYQS